MDSETVIISRYGAKLRLGPFHSKMVCGDHVRVCQRGSYTWRTARIAWIDRTTSSYCGIELQDPENFWGVYFPEKPAPESEQAESGKRAFTPLAIRAQV